MSDVYENPPSPEVIAAAWLAYKRELAAGDPAAIVPDWEHVIPGGRDAFTAAVTAGIGHHQDQSSARPATPPAAATWLDDLAAALEASPTAEAAMSDGGTVIAAMAATVLRRLGIDPGHRPDASVRLSYEDGPPAVVTVTFGGDGEKPAEARCHCREQDRAHQHETDEDGVCRHCGCEEYPQEDDGECGHECEQGGVGYRCERPAGHPIDGYGPKFRHAAGIDADLAEGTDEGDGFGTADLVTWGEDEIGGEQDVAVDWGTIAAYGTEAEATGGKGGGHA